MQASPHQLFKGLAPQGIAIVAVSGGSDSLSLLLLANAWAASRDVGLHAVTVDHGLRPEAAAEAAFVASICDGLGIDHTTLAWEGIKPHSGIANAARRARYTLIEEFAQEIGADVILTGHTADDQAETVYMRLNRGCAGDTSGASGTGRGLAGMSRRSLLPGGCELYRPLLGIRRGSLRSYLAGFPQNWIEDPTNHDESFERVRVRRRLADDNERTIRLINLADVMGGFRTVLSRDTAELLAATISCEPGGVLMFDYAIARAAPGLVLIHALQMILAVAGGNEYLVARSRIESLLDSVERFDFSRSTLGSAVIERSGDCLRFYREKRDIPSIRVEPGETAIWDGRLAVTNNGPKPVRIGPLTRSSLRDIEDRRGKKFRVHPRAALLTCGLISAAGGEQWLPTVEPKNLIRQVSVRQGARAIEHFCPQSDFALLDWLRKLDKARSESLQSRA